MNRRSFVAAGGLLAAGTAARTAAGSAAIARKPDPTLFKTIDFAADGLGLSPREYATLLDQLAATHDLQADYYSNGGLVEDLERTFARVLGKESAILLPTGTLANHLAVRKLAGADRRVLVQAESHLYNDSGDCAQILSGLNLIPLAAGSSTIDLTEVQQWVERSAGGRVETKVGVISIETPVRRLDHQMFSIDELRRICAYARERGIRLHLDGARMFNLPHHSGVSLLELAALFDTVYVSVWKHFNGAAGAILAGDKSFIEGLFHTRRLFGGSLHNLWPTVALAAQFVDGYQADYAKAWDAADELIAQLAADDRFDVRKVPDGTSRFLLTVRGAEPAPFSERLAKKGVMLPQPKPDSATFPMQVNPTLARTTPQALSRLFIEAA